MKLSPTLIAAASFLALGVMSAQAGCINLAQRPGPIAKLPQKFLQSLAQKPPGSRDAGQNIVGTWLVTYTVEGNPFGQAYIQWHDDRTEWENINLPISGGNICLGSWQQLDLRHVQRNHWGWLYTNGTLSGYFNETETDKVERNGTYTGTNDQKIYDLNGHLLQEVTGTSSAVKVAP